MSGQEPAAAEQEVLDGLGQDGTEEAEEEEAAMTSPSTNLGTESGVKQKTPSKRKKAADPEDDEDALAAEIKGTGESDADVLMDPVLKMMCDELKNVPPCFSGLLPNKVLYEGMAVGKQLRGVAWLSNTTWLSA